MVPTDTRWVYEPHRTKANREWLRWKSGSDTLAQFMLCRNENGRIMQSKVGRECLTMIICRAGVSMGIGRRDIFPSLYTSSVISKMDRDCLWAWRDKFRAVRAPVFEDVPTFIQSASRKYVREFEEFFRTPEGLAMWHSLIKEATLEIFSTEEIMDDIRSGNIKVN